MNLSDLIKGGPKLFVTLHNGSVLEFTRKPFTDALSTAIGEITPGKKESVASLKARQLAAVIATWEVSDDTGQPLPVSAETLIQMDLRDLLALDAAVASDFFPPRAASETSGAGSPPTES